MSQSDCVRGASPRSPVCLLLIDRLSILLQVFIGSHHVGGAAELETLQRNGQLLQLLAQSRSSSLPKGLEESVAQAKVHAEVCFQESCHAGLGAEVASSLSFWLSAAHEHRSQKSAFHAASRHQHIELISIGQAGSRGA